MALPSFADLGVSSTVVAELERQGIGEPFAIQGKVLPDSLAGRNVLARSRTGSGKTLAFAITLVERISDAGRAGSNGRPYNGQSRNGQSRNGQSRNGQSRNGQSSNGQSSNASRDGSKGPSALVLVPTRELALQVLNEIKPLAAARGLRSAAAYGGTGLRASGEAAARADILVATPGRLDDIANRRWVSLDGVRILILDEADRMLDMGFLPQVEAIVRRIPADRQTMFLSATLDGQVGRLAARYAPNAVLHEVESARPTVDEATHRFVPVTSEGKVASLAKLISEEPGLVLVFVRIKRGADRLVQKLKQQGVHAAAMHGDLTQRARERALERFQAGKVRALVATDVAARGLHVEAIANVVNYDPPEDHTAYVHRVGRTARAGATGIGTTLVLPEQQADVSRIAAQLQLESEFSAEGMKVAPARSVFVSKKGRRSLLYRPPARRR